MLNAGARSDRGSKRNATGPATPQSLGSSDDFSEEGEEASETEAEDLQSKM
jgi:hypothetical protein